MHFYMAILTSRHLLGPCVHARYKRRLFEKYYTMDTSVKRHQQVKVDPESEILGVSRRKVQDDACPTRLGFVMTKQRGNAG